MHYLTVPAEQPACAQKSSMELITSMTQTIYAIIDCPECLDRAIAEAEARLVALRARRSELVGTEVDPW